MFIEILVQQLNNDHWFINWQTLFNVERKEEREYLITKFLEPVRGKGIIKKKLLFGL